MTYIQQITKVRKRGQMTVPKEIREELEWPVGELLVRVETITNGFKVERLPISHPQFPKKKLSKKEAAKIWEGMGEISRKGKKGVNLTAFLREDRDTHF